MLISLAKGLDAISMHNVIVEDELVEALAKGFVTLVTLELSFNLIL